MNQQPGMQDKPLSVLTPREIEVLKLIAEGHTSNEIATLLNISVTAVEAHRRQIMFGLGIDSIARLTKYAIRQGVTTVYG